MKSGAYFVLSRLGLSALVVSFSVLFICILFVEISLNNKMALNKTARQPSTKGKNEGSRRLPEIGLPKLTAVTK